jgi:hypothetical protein
VVPAGISVYTHTEKVLTLAGLVLIGRTRRFTPDKEKRIQLLRRSLRAVLG